MIKIILLLIQIYMAPSSMLGPPRSPYPSGHPQRGNLIHYWFPIEK